MKKEQMKKACAKTLVREAKKYTETQVNTTCPWYHFQPQLPAGADKLRKHV